jgi:hypothetical protein
MFFNTWFELGRVIVIGACAYAALVALLRVSGKRTLSKMNAFDLVVTVALGSTLATVLLSKDVALAEGVLAFGVLILLQFMVAWLSVRSAMVNRLIKSEPALLLHQGQLLRGVMAAERVNEEEIRAAARARDWDTRGCRGGGIGNGRELYRPPADGTRIGFDPRRRHALAISAKLSCRNPRAPAPAAFL